MSETLYKKTQTKSRIIQKKKKLLVRLKQTKSQKKLKQMRQIKVKKIEERKVVVSEKKSSQSIFSDKTVTLLKGKLEKQYGIDHRKEKRVT